MSRQLFTAATAATLAIALPFTAHAQDSTRAKPDSSATAMAGEMDHMMMGPWKEMNAFHKVLGATWHPASKNDLVPLRVRARELRAAADAWAASKAPESPASCGSEEVHAAIVKVARDMRAIVLMISAEADDSWLAGSLKAVHDSFETVEAKCGAHG